MAAANQKNDWRIKGASIYFIDIKQTGFPLYYGKIVGTNEDGTFNVEIVCQTIGMSKDPIRRAIEGKSIHPMKI